MSNKRCLSCGCEDLFGGPGRPPRYPICKNCRCGVYAICCPDSGDMVYIGSSTNIPSRVAQHLWGLPSEKAEWAQSWLARGRPPVLRVLEVAEPEKLRAAERQWIAAAQLAGHGLQFNHHYATTDLAGRTFGRWRVLEQVGEGRPSSSRWVCECECGAVREVSYVNLTAGLSTSCGAHRAEQADKPCRRTR